MKKKCLHLFKAYKYVLGMLRKDESDYYDKHIKSCNFCTELVNNVKKTPRGELEDRIIKITKALSEEKEFERELRVKGCPTTDEMMNYVHGRLYSKKRAYIENHIKSCEYCREDLRVIEKIEKEFGEND
ncbi:hypothetical protein KAW96_01475 [candidate division WOR-3 bacterium]|nr:hypothetical protein [candidate division WOR-3 bacterium]